MSKSENPIRRAVYDAILKATGYADGDCFWHDHPERKCFLVGSHPPDDCINGMCWCADILRDAEKAIMEARTAP